MSRVVTGLVMVTRWPVHCCGHENLAAASPSTSPGQAAATGLASVSTGGGGSVCDVISLSLHHHTPAQAPPDTEMRASTCHLPGATTWSGVNMTDTPSS